LQPIFGWHKVSGYRRQKSAGIIPHAQRSDQVDCPRPCGRAGKSEMMDKTGSAPIQARTMLELKQKIYEAHGWTRQPGESQAERIQRLYDVTMDHRNGQFVATAKPSASSNPRS